MSITRLTDKEKHNEIVELLEAIKETNEEIRDELIKLNENKENEDKSNEFDCDSCDETTTGEPYKQVNKFVFCSHDCWSNWINDK